MTLRRDSTVQIRDCTECEYSYADGYPNGVYWWTCEYGIELNPDYSIPITCHLLKKVKE